MSCMDSAHLSFATSAHLSFTVRVNLRMARFPIHEKFHRKLWQDVQARRAFELFGVSRERAHS